MKTFGNDANIQPMPNPKPLTVLRGTSCIVTRDEKGNIKEGEWTTALVHGVTVYPNELIRR
jgi:hypothetical protein